VRVTRLESQLCAYLISLLPCLQGPCQPSKRGFRFYFAKNYCEVTTKASGSSSSPQVQYFT